MQRWCPRLRDKGNRYPHDFLIFSSPVVQHLLASAVAMNQRYSWCFINATLRDGIPFKESQEITYNHLSHAFDIYNPESIARKSSSKQHLLIATFSSATKALSPWPPSSGARSWVIPTRDTSTPVKRGRNNDILALARVKVVGYENGQTNANRSTSALSLTLVFSSMSPSRRLKADICNGCQRIFTPNPVIKQD